MVYLASFPRSGNTLLRMILFHHFGIETASVYGGEFRNCAHLVGHVAKSEYMKTHEVYDGTPGRHIYIERDWDEVRNSMINMYGHIRTRWGTHEDHVESWRKADTLWLRFHALKSEQTLQSLEEFTGKTRIPGASIPSWETLHSLDSKHFWQAGRC